MACRGRCRPSTLNTQISLHSDSSSAIYVVIRPRIRSPSYALGPHAVSGCGVFKFYAEIMPIRHHLGAYIQTMCLLLASPSVRRIYMYLDSGRCIQVMPIYSTSVYIQVYMYMAVDTTKLSTYITLILLLHSTVQERGSVL